MNRTAPAPCHIIDNAAASDGFQKRRLESGHCLERPGSRLTDLAPDPGKSEPGNCAAVLAQAVQRCCHVEGAGPPPIPDRGCREVVLLLRVRLVCNGPVAE